MMPLIAPADVSMCRRLLIGAGASDAGPRLGGRAPALDVPLSLAEGSQYVLTFPLFEHPDGFVSVFINGGPNTLWSAMNQGLQPDDRILAVRHGATPRGRSERFSSDVSAHPLVIAPDPERDVIVNEQGESLISSGHKLGGKPYCIQEPTLAGADALMARGFVHALQLDFPSRADGAVNGNWPFADGMFNLFIKPDDPDDIRWAFQK
jgi:hypothetical protein